MRTGLERWRAEFPILASKTYLASHSLGAVPRRARDALGEYYDEWARLGVQAWDGPWWEAVREFGRDLEAILHAPPGTVAPLPNATRAMAAVASCLDYRPPRNRIVLTDQEFTTFYPFWRGQERLGAELVVVHARDGIAVPPSDLAAVVDRRTLLVATCHGYFRSGAVQDVPALAAMAHASGAYLLVDGYQTVGSVPVDVQRSDVDFFLGGSHKWLCGGAGAGYLYTRKELLGPLRPRLTGWFGLRDPFAFRLDPAGGPPADGAFRFLDGTPNVPGLYAAREGIRIIRRVGVDAIRRASLRQTQAILDRADALGLEARTPRAPERRNGMVCLQFPAAREAADALVRQGIIVDWRPDCGLRVSPHFYNNAADLERFFDALEPLARQATVRPRRPRKR